MISPPPPPDRRLSLYVKRQTLDIARTALANAVAQLEIIAHAEEETGGLVASIQERRAILDCSYALAWLDQELQHNARASLVRDSVSNPGPTLVRDSVSNPADTDARVAARHQSLVRDSVSNPSLEHATA